MARQSVLERNEPFIAAALLTAHGLNLNKGFRQVEIRWNLELFANWIEVVHEHAGFSVQNTQTGRYLSRLIEEGFARQITKGKYPLYRLTRPGLFEVVSRFVRKPYFARREHFFFVYFFIRAYRKRLVKMVEFEGKHYSYAMQMELNALLDADVLLDDQLAYVRRELSKLDKRLTEQQQTLDLAQELFKQGQSYQDVIKEIDQRFPFSLDPQRRYAELYKKATERQSAWELTAGTASRLRDLWLPSHRMLKNYLAELEALKKESVASPVSWPGLPPLKSRRQ